MAHFTKDAPGGAAGHYWHEAGDIVEVLEDDIAVALRKIPGFREVTEEEITAPPPVKTVVTEPAPAAKVTEPAPAKAAVAEVAK